MMEEKRVYQRREHSLVYGNIKALAKYKGIRMQDIEKSIYRQVGYLSRGLTLTANELMKISDILGVSMDDLMRKDYEQEIGVLNVLMLVKVNIEELHKHIGKDECMKELIRVLNEVYG